MFALFLQLRDSWPEIENNDELYPADFWFHWKSNLNNNNINNNNNNKARLSHALHMTADNNKASSRDWEYVNEPRGEDYDLSRDATTFRTKWPLEIENSDWSEDVEKDYPIDYEAMTQAFQYI